MDENFQSKTKLTEFAPLAPEEKEQGVANLISKIFKFGKSAITGESSTSTPECSNTTDNVSQESFSSWSNVDIVSETASKTENLQNYQYNVDINEGRNLPNVLKRISNLLALKSTSLQAYGDTELKQYWMPDSVSRECYECGEKFTTFRRRHHCRICGQIFCSQCCNQKIPGKIVGCTGDLRACTYCCKVVLTYLQTPDVSIHLTADLRAFQEDLQTKFATDQMPQSITSVSSTSTDISDTGSLRRKVSVGYQEEKFALGRGSSTTYLSTEERIRALQNSISLRNLYEELCRPSSGMILQTHRYRLRSYPNTLLGSELVDWLISQRKAHTRVQASAISQALFEAGYLDCVTEQNTFCDGWALYRLQLPACQELFQPEQKLFDARSDEPSWMQQVPHESSTTDSEAELPSPCTEKVAANRLPSSSSSYLLDLNFEESTVHLIRPPAMSKSIEEPNEDAPLLKQDQPVEAPIVKTSEHRELVPETGWYNATDLRDDNGERIAYELLTNVYKQHEYSLLSQLLSANNLSLNWREIIIPLIREIVDKIRPDLRHDAEYLDIRNYIQFKKLSGGNRSECKLVEGIVYTKNIAHRGMASQLDNPKILLLNCSLVYQRKEGRLMSLEPVILQEHEYLRNVAARIVALQPNIVLVHKNVSRLAQDLLRDHKITLVLNVKLSILERLARCTNADLVTAVDAQIGQRSKLGTCKHFYLKTFHNTETAAKKTLMFFEGLPLPHLGATILLRGGAKPELTKLKQVFSTLIFSTYNWRLEKSFLMDEFAQPPTLKADEFFGDGSSKESSPDFNVNIELKDKEETKTREETRSFDYSVPLKKESVDSEHTKDKSSSTISRNSNDEKRLPVESIEDFSDPLHLYLTVEDDVFKVNNSQQFSVAELPFSNKFRKALDDTILSVSPYLSFSIPYLETDLGRKCKLRLFFPDDIYYSEQFVLKSENSNVRNGKENIEITKKKNVENKVNPPHPFISANISQKISESPDLQTVLANFRACGGRLPHRQLRCSEEDLTQMRQKEIITPQLTDILDLQNHQKLVVLFCSFSHSSNNAPAFCVDPWVVNMYFYGKDDIPLGCFLERFCFRSTYDCPSETCDTPMLKHVRRFVHSSGCVSLTLNSFDSQFKEEDIVMWSFCTKCSAVSPVVPMSSDTWSFSLAKYLELRFHGHIYSRRGNSACSHSLHHDNYHYFGYKNIVATFKYEVIRYSTVRQWEVSLPPPLIQINYDTANQQNEIIDEIKSLALRGHEIFSVILERLTNFPTEGEGLNILKQQHQKEHNVFKGKVEEVQLKLTSPTLEDKKLKEFSQEDVRTLIWPLEDLMVQIKRIMADTVEIWNIRLFGSKKDPDKRKDKKEQSHDTDYSENEGSASPDTRLSETVDSEIPKECAIAEISTPINISLAKKIKSLDHGDYETSVLKIPILKVNLHDIQTSTPLFETEEEEKNIKEILYLEGSNKKLASNSKLLTPNMTDKIPIPNFDTKFSWLLTPIKKITSETGFRDDVENFTLNKRFRKCKSYPLDDFTSEHKIKYYVQVSDDNSHVSHSPKGHFRSQSDGTVMAQSDDFLESRKESSDKKSVKTILTQLLQSVHGISQIPNPFTSQEHHLLPITSVPIVVYENEPGSIIAYALDSHEYKKSIDELIVKKVATVEQSPSPVHKRKQLTNSERPSSTDLNLSGERHSGILSFLWTQKDAPGTSPVVSAGETSEPEDIPPNKEKIEDAKKSKPPYIEVEFQDVNCNFCCRVYFAERFVWLRTNVIPAGEEAYIRSLRRSVQWNARGGKSGSSFCKTKDDRFILKEMTKQELQQFLESANNYFAYMEKCISSKVPTLLGKIVGVYTILFRNVTTNNNLRMNLLVMENLFYNRTVTHKFDLKGSMRNRLVNPDDQDQGEIVLLDENLLKRTCESPLYIYPHSKAVLTAAIQSDTKFLSSQKVMDYSLLVGLDEDTQELVVGIIDYIRTFTWDKKLEHMVKKAGMLGSQGKTPTIISPENYRDRFIAAMHRYFLQVPDRWTGLGKGLEC